MTKFQSNCSWLLAIGIWTYVCSPSTAQELEAQIDGRVENLGLVLTAPWLENADQLYWQQDYIQHDTEYLRLHISVDALPEAIQGFLKLRGENSQEIIYSTEELRSRKDFWSEIIEGGYVLVSFHATSKPNGVRIALDQISYQADGPVPFSTWGGTDDKQPINHPSVSPIVTTVERPVARLRFQKNGRPSVCSGFLISNNELMTNRHCVDDAKICDSLVASFGYQYDMANKLHFGKKYNCHSFDPAKSDANLDFSIVKLSGKPGEMWGFIDMSTALDPMSGNLFIIQHPGGKPKKVAEVDCRIIEPVAEGHAPDIDFTHTCDTEGGSSGSPVFDREGKLVGLHHFGFKEASVRGWTENRAVRISKIMDWLNGQP